MMSNFYGLANLVNTLQAFPTELQMCLVPDKIVEGGHLLGAKVAAIWDTGPNQRNELLSRSRSKYVTCDDI